MADVRKTNWVADKVYPPSDDSFILIDAFQRVIQNRPSPQKILEVGSGSGYVATSVALVTGKQVVATDVNPAATECTRKTAEAHGVGSQVDVVLTEFWNGLVADSFDWILFNPPYVPTPTSEIESGGLSVSWAGGKNGRTVIDEFMARIYQLLASQPLEVLLVMISENNPHELINDVTRRGFLAEVILERKADEEQLFVLNIRQKF